MSKVKIIAIGDFHGKFSQKLFACVKKEKPDLIFCPGDFYGGTNIRNLLFKYWDKLKPDAYGLIGAESLIPILGKKKIMKFVSKETSGRDVLKKLNKLGFPVFFVYGNSDPSRKAPWRRSRGKIKSKIIEDIIKPLKNIKQIEYSSHKFNSLNIAGFGCKYTQKGIRKESKLKARERIRERKMLKKLLSKKPAILLTHEPPYGILDKIRDKKSPRYGQHMGDKYILEAIKKYQPLLSIFGHLHENQGMKKIGKTIAINPGTAFEGRYAIIELDSKIKIKLKRAR